MIKTNHPWKKWETKKPEEPKSKDELGGPKRRKYNRAIKRVKGEQKILKLIEQYLPDLFKEEGCPDYGEQEIDKVLHHVYEELNGYALKYLHNFFIKGLEQFNKDYKCTVPVPDSVSTNHRVRSPFRHENYHKLHLIKPLVKQFNLSIEDPLFFDLDSDKYTIRKDTKKKTKDSKHIDLWIGQIIFSSIYKGALLNVKLIYALVEAIEQRSLIVEDGYVWFDFKISKKTSCENKVLRRWFPDSLSALLILRLFKVNNKNWPEKFTTQSYIQYAQKCFKLYLCCLGMKVSEQPSLSQFINISIVNLDLYISPYLVNIAKTFDLAPSLSAETWVRLCKHRRLKKGLNTSAKAEKKVTDDAIELTAIIPINNLSKTSSQRPKLIELERILSGHKKKTPRRWEAKRGISKWLERNSNLSPIMQALTEWCLEKIAGRINKPSSMHTYLSSIGGPLILRIGNRPLNQFEIDDWETIYSSILKNSKNTDFKASILVKFHQFLVKRYDIVNIEIEYSSNKIVRRPNVNLLSLQEYQNTFYYLANNDEFSNRLKTIQQLLLILGYRCGLRKTEALTLRVKDLQTVSDPQNNADISDLRPELLIVNNLYATVKNNSSVRRIPLILFLNKAEIALLFKWKQKRMRELSNTRITNQLLFCNSGEDSTPLSTKETSSHIQKSMRFITGDNRLRFHHLRHSFANFSLLKLLSGNTKGLIPDHWQDNKQKLVNLPVNLTPEHILLSPNKVSRRLLYAVSTICGHLDPKETIQTYIHLLDWVLVHELRKYEEPLSIAAQENLLDLKNSSLRSRRSRKKMAYKSLPTELLKITAKKYSKKYNDPVLKKTEKPKSMSALLKHDKNEDKCPSPFVLYSIFHRYYQNKNIETISQQLGYPVSEIKRWVKNAEKISIATSPRKHHSRFVRAKYKVLTADQLNRWPTLEGLCPAPPKLALDKEDAKEIYFNLLEYYETQPDKLLKLLRKYWQRTSFETNFFIPRNDPDDKEQRMLVELLEAMGVSRYRKRVNFEPNPKKNKDDQLKYWKKLFKLPTENFHIEERKSGQNTQNKNGKARIWVSRKGQKFPNNEKHLYQANESIRFALYMIMVVITP